MDLGVWLLCVVQLPLGASLHGEEPFPAIPGIAASVLVNGELQARLKRFYGKITREPTRSCLASGSFSREPACVFEPQKHSTIACLQLLRLAPMSLPFGLIPIL